VSRRMLGLWALVVLLALLGFGTISNQVRINRANATLAAQAEAGQKGLDRQCKLLPVGKKLYAWGLKNSKESGITPADYDLVISTANTACP
jgi:hypothetical protein